jgi:hypothetical protein
MNVLDARTDRQLAAQGRRCAYADCPYDGRFEPGDRLALAYDGQAIVHLDCACIGHIPAPGDPGHELFDWSDDGPEPLWPKLVVIAIIFLTTVYMIRGSL